MSFVVAPSAEGQEDLEKHARVNHHRENTGRRFNLAHHKGYGSRSSEPGNVQPLIMTMMSQDEKRLTRALERSEREVRVLEEKLKQLREESIRQKIGFLKEIQILRDINSPQFSDLGRGDYLNVQFFNVSEGLDPPVVELLNLKL